jgi:molecular chaperone Hsp33
MQAQTESGIIDLLVSDYRGGELRGYVRFDPDRLTAMTGLPTLQALFGKGYLASPSDQSVSGERYQGSSRSQGASLAGPPRRASTPSPEQIPSLVPLVGSTNTGHVAGGILHPASPGRRRRARAAPHAA